MLWDCVICLRISPIATLLTVSSRVNPTRLFHKLFVLLGKQLSYKGVTSSSYKLQGQEIVFPERFIISFELQWDFRNGNKISGAAKLHSWHLVEILYKLADDP